MFEPLLDARTQARAVIDAAAKQAAKNGLLQTAELSPYIIETPADSSHGDLAANAALVSAKALRMPPRKIAEAICECADLENTLFVRIECAGPGFINLFLGDEYFRGLLRGILDAGEDYGKTCWGCGKRYNVEFVSANPTGPMHLGNARGGALGDCLAGVLEAAGCEVTREFYINDAGNQIEKFGCSLEARYLQLYCEGIEFPEDGYHGEDITDLAKEYAAEHGDSLLALESSERRRALVEFALPKNIARMKQDLSKYRIDYDVWFPESTLYQSGAVEDILNLLKEKGLTYEKDGAVWYKATQFGDEKDEVLVRSNGIPTYFAGDIAYHYNKLAVRGFDRAINVWGADHHGHVARLKGAMDAVGLDGNRLDIVLMQLVKLMRGGEVVRMSKRTGKAIALADLLDEVPVDAARFFFNLRDSGSVLDFDLDLAVQNSSDNPVYYVQYAHARICSILKMLEANGFDYDRAKQADGAVLTEPTERALLRGLAALPDEINSAAQNYDPALITRYTVELAGLFHRFYANCRCKADSGEIAYPRAALCIATKITLENCLRILEVVAPESM